MWSDLRYRLRSIFRRTAMERELEEELQFHLEHDMKTRGPEALAGIEQIKEACRDERGTAAIDRLRQDVRYACRMFTKHPAFTVAVVGTLALGIGGATAMFGVVDGVLLKPLPYRDADRIVHIGRSFGGVRVSATSAIDFHSLASRGPIFTSIAVSQTTSVDIEGDGAPERAEAANVSASYFDVLGVAPARGQALIEGDDLPGGRKVALISHSLWRRRLNSASDVIGRAIVLNGQSHTIVGVMPPRFRGPDALGQQEVDIWLPLGQVRISADADDASFGTIASLRPGADLTTAVQETARIAGDPHRFWIAPLHAETIGDAGPGLWLIFGAISLLLILACSNIANLFLVRATERRREIALRVAIGASSGRIGRQLVTETLLFALAGGLLGALLAYGGLAAVRVWAPSDLPRIGDLNVDVRVLLFAFFVATGAGIACGLLPAVAARRADVAGVLRTGSIVATTAPVHLRHRAALVILQTALATMLVVGAALLGHSVIRLTHVDPGFYPANVVWMDVSLPERSYAGAQAKVVFFDQLLSRTRGTAGLESVSIVQGRPLGGGNAVATVAPEGQLPTDAEQPARVPYHIVAPAYFETLRIKVIDGRDFSVDDRGNAPRVAIVSRAFADRFWKGDRAVGKRFWMGRVAADAPLTEVIGVAEDVRQYGLSAPPVPMVYRPLAQAPRGTISVVARHDGRAPTATIDNLRSAVWSLDPSLPVDRAGTMDGEVSRSIREPRFRAIAMSAFGIIACSIACVGLYGSLSWLVRARSRELGIRLALGAAAASVGGLIVARGLALAAVGVALGLGAAGAASHLISSMTFGITHTDVTTYIAAGGAMLVVALVASALPARRATQIDPIAALRE